MRLVKQDIQYDGSGTITLNPEEPEDMWHAYNLIAFDDILRAYAIRRVKTAATNSEEQRKSASRRVHTELSIRVKSIEFDPQAGQLHISGQVCEENEYVTIGQFHTLDLELQRNFTLTKRDGWDSIALDVVREALRQDKEGVIPAVVMHEGLANICLITEHQTILKQRVKAGIPRKRGGRATDHDRSLQSFYRTTYETLIRHVDILQPRPLLIASPGFVGQGFQKYILDEANRLGNKKLLSNKKNLLLIHSSSGHLHSLNEALRSPEVLAKLNDTKYAHEARYMDEFMELLRQDNGKAWYGRKEVEKAVEKDAVGRGGGVLLISNRLFRSQEIGVRKRWVALVDKVKSDGGEARVLSSDHESGKRLEGLGGIAAILTYPIEDLDEDEEGDIPVTAMQDVAI